MKTNLTAIIFGIAIVVASIVLGNAFMNRNNKQGTVSVTGLGQSDFTSDLIVWNASYSQTNRDLKTAYSDLQKNKETIQLYLVSKGIPKENIVFSSVSTNKNSKSIYSDTGKFLGSQPPARCRPRWPPI